VAEKRRYIDFSGGKRGPVIPSSTTLFSSISTGGQRLMSYGKSSARRSRHTQRRLPAACDAEKTEPAKMCVSGVTG
jgi:hypothetical protein